MGKSKEEGNRYDKIFKENIEPLFLPLVERILNIKIVEQKVLREKLQITTEREVDSLRLVKTDKDEKFLLNLEFQLRNDKNMLYRLGAYHGIIQEKRQIPIKHVVIYLGRTKPRMESQLPPDQVYEGFQLVSLQSIAYQEFLSSQVPEEIMLATLGDFGVESRERIMRAVIEKLMRVVDSQRDLQRFIKQLQVLSKLRNLEDITTKIVNDMPITIDWSDHILWKKGEEKGLEKGLVEGLEKGAKQNALKTAAKMLEVKTYTDEQILDITGISAAELAKLKEK